MKKKKRYIVVLVALVIYAVLMVLVLGKDMLIKNKDNLTLIVGDTSIWVYKEEGWTNITMSSTIDELNWRNYDVYFDNKKIGNYYLWNNDDKWYIFDKKKQAVKRDGNLLGINTNYEVKVQDFKLNDIRNYYYVEKILEQNDLSTSSKFTVAQETSLDIDNDGKIETFYFVGNAFSLDYTSSKTFSFVFMVKNGKIYPMYTDVAPNSLNNGCKPYLNAVIDYDQDNNYEMIISCGRYSANKPVDMLYKLTDEEFNIVISNQ